MADSRNDPLPTDGVEGGGIIPGPPPPPRPRYLQIIALLLGILAVGAGFLGKADLMLILCGLSVLANAVSLGIEGNKRC